MCDRHNGTQSSELLKLMARMHTDSTVVLPKTKVRGTKYITLHYITLHYITLHYITLHYITLHYITLHYITLHYITLHYITLHYITLHYITLHYITLHYITLHYITLHYITLHYITLHYITLHYITLHYITLHYITLHYITLHYITLHYITLHYITLHYITLHYITLHYITLHYINTYIHTQVRINITPQSWRASTPASPLCQLRLCETSGLAKPVRVCGSRLGPGGSFWPFREGLTRSPRDSRTVTEYHLVYHHHNCLQLARGLRQGVERRQWKPQAYRQRRARNCSSANNLLNLCGSTVPPFSVTFHDFFFQRLGRGGRYLGQTIRPNNSDGAQSGIA